MLVPEFVAVVRFLDGYAITLGCAFRRGSVTSGESQCRRDLVEQRPPWAPPTFAISSKDAAIRALQDPRLLDSFFSRLKDMCTLISAASGTSSADVSLAWDMTELKKVNVLVYGQTGAGKSTLIGELIGQSSLGGARLPLASPLSTGRALTSLAPKAPAPRLQAVASRPGSRVPYEV